MKITTLYSGCRRACFTFAGAMMGFAAPAQEGLSPYVGETFWAIEERQAIVWDVASEQRLPHSDHIEMAGRRVASVIDYGIDENRKLTIRRNVIYPQLRVFPKTDSPSWFEYRAYLQHTYTDDSLPVLLIDQVRYELPALEKVAIDGTLRFQHATADGIQVERAILPAMRDRLLMERWTVTNRSDRKRSLDLLPVSVTRIQKGPEGTYELEARSVEEGDVTSLAPRESMNFAIYFEARLQEDSPVSATPSVVARQRADFLSEIQENLVLRTPDPVIDTLFYFSKIRAAESIFESRLGLIHSPGGGNYYVGVWANDQAEYSGPFFPYLGYGPGNEAALNAYLTFRDNIPEGDGKIFSSFEMEGELTCCSKDRGDAAMLAFGASQFALARGDSSIAREIWPLIEWGLDYCERHLNEAGVVRSQSDEMEGRIPTGTANLATSSLYYGALNQAALLAEALAFESEVAVDFSRRASELAKAIEAYFGAEIAGLRTYRYYEGHEALRHWISLPLVVGLHERSEDTLLALFDQMWSENGVRVEWSPEKRDTNLFWDRGTLYALRGAFIAGAADLGLDRWQAYSKTRLLGFHVPYVIEAWPENNMRHLSAESALYARIATEGLLGISPNGFDGFIMNPRLPEEWRSEGYRLSNLRLQGRKLDISVGSGEGGKLLVSVSEDGESLFDDEITQGETIQID